MDEMPNAAETIERLAREAERLSIVVEDLRKENAELKAQIDKLSEGEAE